MNNTNSLKIINQFNKQFNYFQHLPNEMDLQEIIDLQKQNIEKNYNQLKNKNITKETFFNYWIYEELYKKYSQINTAKLTDQNKFAVLLKKYNYYLPFDILDEFKTKVEKGDKFDNIPNKKLKIIFKKIIDERNLFATQNNFKSQLELTLHIHKINKNDFLYFKKNYLKSKLQNSNYKCEICNLKSFPFNNLDEVQEYTFSKLKKAKTYSKKIKIIFNETNNIQYKKESDEFVITINKNVNLRHQMLSLMHEICHIETFVNLLEKNENPIYIGKYTLEKDTLKILLKLLKKLNNKLNQSYYQDLQHLVRDNIFQIDIYKDSNKLQKKYLQINNQLNIKVANPNIYLYNKDFILNPFTSLIHCVSLFNLTNS